MASHRHVNQRRRISIDSALKIALGLISLALTAVGTIVGVVLIPNTGPAWLKPLAVAVLGLAILIGGIFIARALIWTFIQKPVDEARLRGEETLRSYQRALGQLVARSPSPPVEQKITYRVTVGQTEQDDRTHEEYTFTPVSPPGVLWRSVDYASQTAAAAAPGGRLTAEHVGLDVSVERIAPPTGQILHSILQTEDPTDERRLDALVVLEPAVNEGETVRLSADYRAPGTWSKLRTRGSDHFALRVPEGGSTKEIAVTFVLPPPASGVSWTLTEAPSGTPPCPPPIYPQKPGDPIKLQWSSGQVPQPGRYRFDIRMNPLR